MEHPVAMSTGFSSHRDARKTTTLQHGGTSLKLSEGGESPLLEAHPGSPVDLTGRPPSLATSMASQHLYHGSREELSRFERSPKSSGKMKEDIKRDGMAAKPRCVKNRIGMNENDGAKSPKRRMQVGVQPFYIPAKVPELEETNHATLPGEDRMSIDTATDTTAMDFHFEEENGIWISAIPIEYESRTSLATTTTATSTLVEERFNHGALTVDTSVASSAASMISSAASIQSATTTNSDVYGWEEELDRKTSIEGHHGWEREVSRRLPSGGWTMGPPIPSGVHEYQFKRAESKRKSLLYRVLNISGSKERRGSVDDIGTITPTNECSSTSA